MRHSSKLEIGLIAACLSIAALQGNGAFGQATKAKVAAAVAQADKLAQAGPFQPTWKSLENYQIPEWYKDAKFGIFIHWGVYSVPAFGNE